MGDVCEEGEEVNYHDEIMNLRLPEGRPALLDTNTEARRYKEGHRDARHAAAELAIGADNLIAEMAVENAELREKLAARDAELERVRSAAVKTTAVIRNNSKYATFQMMEAGLELEAALASPAAMEQAQPAPVAQDEGWRNYSRNLKPHSSQIDIEDQIGGGE